MVEYVTFVFCQYGDESYGLVDIPDTTVTVPKGTTIYEFANGVGTITFEEDVTSIGEKAFYYCSRLTSINIPDTVTSIGKNAFSNCSGLASIVIPDSVTSIVDYAFRACSGLTSVTFGSGVTSIGFSAFLDCSELREIICHAVVAPTIQAGTFLSIKSNGVLYYPSGSDYSSWMKPGWSDYLGDYNWTAQEITD